jgi:hypothetical protein
MPSERPGTVQEDFRPEADALSMPEEPVPPAEPRTPPSRPQRIHRGPSLQRFAAAVLASFVAVFGVLALRVSAGEDPALANGSTDASGTPATTTTTTSTSPADPYDAGAASSDDSSSSGATSSSSTDDEAVPSSTSGATTSVS